MTWEIAASFDNAVAAEMARNYLEEHGIRTLLTDQETVATAWQLSQAVGGVKLLVPGEDLDEARDLLDEPRDRPEPDVAKGAEGSAIAASREAARWAGEPGPVEEIVETEADRIADHAVKAMVFGLLAFPLQFYAIYLLLQIPRAAEPLQPQNRWKVPFSLAICLPLLGLLLVPLVFTIAALSDPSAPRWHIEVFDVDAHTVAVDLPNTEERQAATLQLGPELLRGHAYDTDHKDQAFSVLFWPMTARRDPLGEETLVRYVTARVDSWKGKLTGWHGLEHGRFEGVEYRAVHVDKLGELRQVRGQVFAVGEQIVEVITSGEGEACDNAVARRFFRSVTIK